MSASPEKDSSTEKKGLIYVRGLPLSAVFNEKFIEETLDYEPHDGDIIIATYPKTGTTWMQYIVLQILTKGEYFPNLNDMMEKACPFLEMVGSAPVDALTTKPRVYKHHMPYDKVKTNPNAKFVYVYRRPEDTFVSYYYFMKHIDKALDFDQYFEDFLTGDISYGGYCDHVLSYLKREDDGNILMVSYEKLHANTKEEILRIAKFLGDEYYEAIANDESLMDNIIKHTSFDYMKKNLTISFPADPTKKVTLSDDVPREKVDFFRKGIVGDGKSSLKADQLKRLKAVVEERMKGTEVLSEWIEE